MCYKYRSPNYINSLLDKCVYYTTLTLDPAREVRWGGGRTTFPDHFSVRLFDFANENYSNSISYYLCVPPGLGVVQIPDNLPN